MSSLEDLVQRVRRSEHRALGRAITAVERGETEGREILAQLYPFCGSAYLVGITGAPGAGKSTLVDRVATSLSAGGYKIAILAVDPSSPFTGGAVLGDRIRMNLASERAGVYIRSLATRGALGGIAHATRYAASVLDAAGFDFILIETVGVGQAEIDIVKLADLTAVVVVPGMGDTVQSLKAGILEIANVFIVNKADYNGADRLLKDLRSLGELSGVDTPIVKTIATEGAGIEEVCKIFLSALKDRTASGELQRRRRVAVEGLLLERVRELVVDSVVEISRSAGIWDRVVEELNGHTTDPESAAQQILSGLLPGR